MTELAKRPQVSVLEEDLPRWRNIPGALAGANNLLDAYYADQSKYGTLFQAYVMQTKYEAMQLPVTTRYKVIERSTHSAQNVFGKLLHETGKINDLERNVMTEQYRHFTSIGRVDVDYYVYLETEPEVAFARIQERGRPEEADLPLSYLVKLKGLYDDFMAAQTIPVIRINGNVEKADVVKQLKDRFCFERGVRGDLRGVFGHGAEGLGDVNWVTLR
jgi:deoxyadenosine/deoxycytidine kinase